MNDCPFCGGDCELSNEHISRNDKTLSTRINCKELNIHCIVSGKGSICEYSDVQYKRYNAIVAFLLKNKAYQSAGEYKYEFYYDDSSESNVTSKVGNYINVFHLLLDYPQNNFERIEKTLLNLSILYPKVGATIHSENKTLFRVLYCESFIKNSSSEIIDTLLLLKEVGYLRQGDTSTSFKISADGWKRLSEISQKDSNQGFIAIDFSMMDIAVIIQNAVHICGYQDKIMNQHEHNKQIMPELLFQIRQSKFLIADLSNNNAGVYYEAGYAEGLGKEVIVCCKKKPEIDIHFDLKQKNTIFYTNEKNNLLFQLVRRIEATIGLKAQLPNGFFDDIEPPQA